MTVGDSEKKEKETFRHLSLPFSLSAPPHFFSLVFFWCNSRTLSVLVNLDTFLERIKSWRVPLAHRRERKKIERSHISPPPIDASGRVPSAGFDRRRRALFFPLSLPYHLCFLIIIIIIILQPSSSSPLFSPQNSPPQPTAEHLPQLDAHRPGPLLVGLPLLLLLVEVQRRQPSEAAFSRHGLRVQHSEHGRAGALGRDGFEKLLLAQQRGRNLCFDPNLSPVWLSFQLCRGKYRCRTDLRPERVCCLDVLQRPPRKHIALRVRHLGLGRRDQHGVEVRDLLDKRLWLLQERRRVRQLRGDGAAAPEPGAESQPGSDDAAGDDEASSSGDDDAAGNDNAAGDD